MAKGKGNRTAQRQALKQRKKEAKYSGITRVTPIPNQIGKKQRNIKKLNAIEDFYDTILSWSLHGLIEDTRDALDLSVLTEMPLHFEDDTHYFDTMTEIVLEETRASIAQGLKNPMNFLELSIREYYQCAVGSNMILIEFVILRGELSYSNSD